MTAETRDRLFGAHRAFDHPFTVVFVAGLALVLALTPAAAWLLRRRGLLTQEAFAGVLKGWRSWLVLSAYLLAPVLLGALWVVLGVAVLSLLCYREFARATGLFRERLVSLVVVLGVLLVAFAALDNYARLFFACAALVSGLLAVVTLPLDRPRGYVQRTALGVFGFLLFGYSLGYVGFFANDPGYRPVLLWLLAGAWLGDVLSDAASRAGGRVALPNTRPDRTLPGCLVALALTAALVALGGHFVFAGTAVDRPLPLAVLGLGFAALGQLGGLLVAAVRRDVGLDGGAGRGGLLERFEGLLLVAPAAFHYLSLYLGPIGAQCQQRVLTGGG